MKILKRGKRIRKGKRFVCHDCKCEFLAEQGEYRSEGYDQRDWSYIATCPCCRSKVYTREWQNVIIEEEEL